MSACRVRFHETALQTIAAIDNKEIWCDGDPHEDTHPDVID
jgi:hypothetical protein